MSAFPDIVVGAAERVRVLHHEGAWATTSLDRAQKYMAQGYPFGPPKRALAKQVNGARIAAQLGYILGSGIAGQLIDVSIDPGQVAAIAQEVAWNNGQPEPFLQKRQVLLDQNLTRQKGLTPQGAQPSSVGSNCFHLQKHPGIQSTPEGQYVPLNTKLSAWRGNTVFSPLQHFDVVGGVAVFSYDAAKGDLIIALYGSSYMDLDEPEHEAAAAYYVSSPNGQTPANPVEGRSQTTGASSVIYGMYKTAKSMPIDYTFLFQDESTLCDPQKYSKLKEEAADLDLMDLMSSETSLTNKAGLISHLLDVMDCGTTFLRGVPENSNAVGLLELTVWTHFLMEAIPKDRMAMVHGWIL
jgi:hypothetical protein